MMGFDSVGATSRLLVTTALHLRPVQVAHRVRLKGQRALGAPFAYAAAGLVGRAKGAAIGWPSDFVPLDADASPDVAKDLAEGRFTFLGQERDLGSPMDWGQLDAPRLWRFHLHYMEWAWAFFAMDDQDWARAALAGLWRSWRQGAPFPYGDPWSPYVASIRAWTLCGVYRSLIAGAAIEAEVEDILRLHAGYIRSHLERDVGGNHLLKNLKALVGLGVFFGDTALTRLATSELTKQLAIQVLPDGGHFELSPSYHCQVLGDLVDIAGLLRAGGADLPEGLDQAITKMRLWLGAILMPDGDVPLMNDAALVGVDRIASLAPIAAEADERVTVLASSGYVVVRPDVRCQVVMDVGDPCPDELPAHAHADCLSFEMAIDGERVVVDTGTSTYEAGDRRSHERSTAAHNTVEVDGANQTEVWGAFRAARRARATLARVADLGDHIEVTASHDGYRHLEGRPVHRRTWRVGRGWMAIEDEVVGAGSHVVASSLHLANATPGNQILIESSGRAISEAEIQVATDFGVLHRARAMSIRTEGVLPQKLSWSLRWAVGDGGEMDVL